MANSFSSELEKAGGDIVSGMAKTVVIGTGVIVAGSIAIYFISKKMKMDKVDSTVSKIAPKETVTDVEVEEWL